MLYIGVLSIALCAVQVISFPASGWDAQDDTKVMKCIVEVISATLSKPNPVPTSQDCLETLRGDERIISILRHQNLLKELQDLASQGAVERLQKQKKNGGFGEELSGILEKQSNKPLPSEKSPPLGKSSEGDEEKRQSEEEERKRSPEEEDSTEELESNEISKREETSEEEEIDNRITDEINDMELPKDNQEDASKGRTSEEKEPMTKKDQEADGTEDPDKENHKQDSNETDEDDTQREDNSMRISEDSNKDSAPESDNSKETKPDADTIDCTEDDTSSKDLEDSKRWNKMDELAKELRAKKCAAKSSEDHLDQSMKIPPKEPKYDAGSQEAEDRQQWQRSREDSGETEAPILKRAEERKEEEGSANRKTEDKELESLAAIEAELENVAHKLHDLRRG